MRERERREERCKEGGARREGSLEGGKDENEGRKGKIERRRRMEDGCGVGGRERRQTRRRRKW